MADLVVIFGAQAVGKMTVGQELAAITGFKLLHNHMTIDLVDNFFSPFYTKEGEYLNNLFRREIFEAVAKSDLPGLVFTYMFEFDLQSEYDYINSIVELFKANGAEKICFVELTADRIVRLERNKTENRLLHKPTKRDIKRSEELIEIIEAKHRLVSKKDEKPFENYYKIDNTNTEPAEAAAMIKHHFGL